MRMESVAWVQKFGHYIFNHLTGAFQPALLGSFFSPPQGGMDRDRGNLVAKATPLIINFFV